MEPRMRREHVAAGVSPWNAAPKRSRAANAAVALVDAAMARVLLPPHSRLPNT